MYPLKEIEHILKTRYVVSPQDGLIASRKTGQLVGHISPQGYRMLFLYLPQGGKKRIPIHRVIWWHVHGYWPKEIDHIDGDKTNNRISNLREVTHRQNVVYYHKRSGRGLPVGVSYHQRSRKFKAYYCGKYLGTFITPEEAHQAYIEAGKGDNDE